MKHNVGEVSRRVQGRPILAVIKNDGYGIGIVNVARILEPLPEIQGFAVIKIQEALTLREEGVRKPILLICEQLRKESISFGRMHSVSSFGLFQHPDKFLDMVRPGMVLYGIYGCDPAGWPCRRHSARNNERRENPNRRRAFPVRGDFCQSLDRGRGEGGESKGRR